MKSLANWLVVMFMFMYWVFRIIVTYMFATGRDFVTTPLDFNIEIIMLFVTLICMILTISNKKIGPIIYAITYFGYFGVDLFNKIMPALKNYSFNIDIGSTFFSIIAVMIAIFAVMDVLFDNIRVPEQKQTDWFYANKDYDRKLDERADKNNYKLN